MNSRNDLAALVIAYRRFDLIQKILLECKRNEINRIYIAVDGPKSSSANGTSDHNKVLNAIDEFRNQYSGEITVISRGENSGCAASVLSACDWIFELESSAVVLEDDCIPSQGFFEFSRASLPIIESSPEVWLSCGTQFFPTADANQQWMLSKYALTWGWCTTREKWLEISAALKSPTRINSHLISSWERAYWNQGSRRAQFGWVDVWDTLLVQQMLARSRFAILPAVPLISNVGNDDSATHTKNDTAWLHLIPQDFTLTDRVPARNMLLDEWLQVRFFQIRIRHFLSTRITLLLDSLGFRPKIMQDLNSRWEKARIIRH